MGEVVKDPFQSARLVLALRQDGIRNDGVLAAMEGVSRADFVDPALAELAGEDCYIPIPCGQVIPPPRLVAQMLQAAGLGEAEGRDVLVVGTGSGYMTVLAARLSRHVVAVERFEQLAAEAADRLERMGITNVTLRHANGLRAAPEPEAYGAILLTGRVETVPDWMCTALGEGGRLVAPVGVLGRERLMVFGPDGEGQPVGSGRACLPSLVDTVAREL